MHDTVIRGGTIVDGSGEKAYTGDVALDGGRISSVAARRDRRGARSTPTACW